MTLDIKKSSQAGLFEASFDVGAAVGPMKLSAMKEALAKYIGNARNDSESNEDSDEEEASELEVDTTVKAGQKRKGSELASIKSKKAKAASTTYFHTVYKHQETGEGEIDYEPISGHLSFVDDKFATFSGSLDLNFTSGKVVIHGRKISDAAQIEERWEDYSEQAYERARVNRWR